MQNDFAGYYRLPFVRSAYAQKQRLWQRLYLFSLEHRRTFLSPDAPVERYLSSVAKACCSLLNIWHKNSHSEPRMYSKVDFKERLSIDIIEK